MLEERSTGPEVERWVLRRPGGPLAALRKFWSVLSITVATRCAYLGELLMRTTFLVLILYIFTQLWRATSRTLDVAAMTGFGVGQLIWYLAFTESIALSASPPGVDREVRSGDIAYRLARPLSYPLYHMGEMLGEQLLRFALSLVVGCLVALMVVGPITITTAGVVMALSTVLISFVIDRLLVLTIGLLSFWVEDVSGLYLLYSRAVMILGGMLIPLEAYPDWLRHAAAALPFQYLMYQPARLFVKPDLLAWLHLLWVQSLFAAVALTLMLLVYHIGLRRVSAQGG